MSDAQVPSLRDTTPGVPEIELAKTLPTGAAFHATWSIPNLAAAHTLDPSQESGVHTVELSSTASNPPEPEAKFTSTRRGYAPTPAAAPAPGPSKMSAREKAKRNILTHTLQMPLVVSPLPPSAASTSGPAPTSTRPTQRGGTNAPHGWTSMHRVGSVTPGDSGEPTRSRPASRPTDRMNRTITEFHAEFEPDPDIESDVRVAEPARPSSRPTSAFHDPPPYSRRPSAAAPQAGAPWVAQVRAGDYNRNTLPEGTPRIPELSGREWLFIALLACASAATLYSLLIDDVVSVEDTDAATDVEHLVQPAPATSMPAPATQLKAASSSAAPAAATKITEIDSEPSSAEIVVGGAVIGNTPAHVLRGPEHADYLLRKQGWEPQIVRVSENSPERIVITLHPKQ